MNGQSNQPGAGDGFDARLRTMRILWGAYLMTIVIYVVASALVLSPWYTAPEGAADATALAALAAAGLTSVAASFLLKGRFYAQAAEEGSPAKFQTGFIVAAALCEVAGLLGFVGIFFSHSRESFLLFALGALGLLLHFPRRDQLAAAYRKGF
jgi:hypothetical protein